MNYRAEIMYEQYQSAPIVENEIPDFVGAVPVGLPICQSDDVDILMPINPVTGHRDGDLSRLFDPMVSTSEKELIISSLKELKASNSSKDLTDEDIIQMIPSRYMSDPVEINRYLDELKEIRDSLLTPSDPDPTPTDPTSTDPTPTDLVSQS